MDTLLLRPQSAWAMEVVNLQTQKSITKLAYAVLDTRTVDLFPLFSSFLNYVIQSCYFTFNLYLFLSFLSSTLGAHLPDFLFSSSFPSKPWSFLPTNSLSYIIRNGPRLSCDASLPPISSKAPICPRRERNLWHCSQFSHRTADAATAHVGPVSSVS